MGEEGSWNFTAPCLDEVESNTEISLPFPSPQPWDPQRHMEQAHLQPEREWYETHK